MFGRYPLAFTVNNLSATLSMKMQLSKSNGNGEAVRDKRKNGRADKEGLAQQNLQHHKQGRTDFFGEVKRDWKGVAYRVTADARSGDINIWLKGPACTTNVETRAEVCWNVATASGPCFFGAGYRYWTHEVQRFAWPRSGGRFRG